MSHRIFHTRFIRLIAGFTFALGGLSQANDTFLVKCKKKCSSCSSGTCSPENDTYEVVATFDNNNQAQDAANNLNNDPNSGWTECKVEQTNSVGNGGTYPSTDTSPGLTPLNYKRQGLLFEGVSPDYVKYETVNETVNGVTTQVKKPIQLPTLHSTIFYTDLADGSGYQCAQYLNSQLSTPDANGLRTIPAGVQATSITVYRNPDGNADTPSGKLDVIHKQRHPQTGAWVTRTIRKTAPQGNNHWKTEFYLGNPQENPTLPAYREITITRTPNPTNIGEESTREITRDRDSSGALVITSDLSVTYGFYKYGDPVKLSETAHTGTGSELTRTWTYYTAPGEQASFNKPATLRRSDGQWANYTYQGSPVTGILLTKTVSGWLDQPAPAAGVAPDEATSHVVTELEARNETGTYSREETIQGVLVSKTWGERYKDPSGLLIDKSRVETGSATLTTVRTGWPNDTRVPEADRGRLKSILHPDGTVELHSHTLQGDNLVTTVDKGSGTLDGVTDGTRTVSTLTRHDTLIKEVVSDIASGIVLSSREAIAFDSEDQPTRWAHDNDPDDYTETLNGCCGIDRERSRDGLVTTYTRDGLKRPLTSTRQGITLTYTYGKKTINGTDFPSTNLTATAGGLTHDQGTTVYDHAGNVIQEISPDLDGDGNPELTTTARDFAARTTTTTQADGGTLIQTDYADGQPKSTTGTATAAKYYGYTTHTQQGGGRVIATAPTATGPWNRTYQNLAGRTLKTTFQDGATETVLQANTYDSLGRVLASTDADGVTQLVAYNAKGEAYRRALDLNQNGQIDSTDRITDTLSDILNVPGFGPALRSQTVVYDSTNTARLVSTNLTSPDRLLTRQDTLGVATPSLSQRASYLDRADGSWTDTTTAPDGTKSSVTYSNFLPVTQARLDTANNVIESTTTGHDALQRPVTRTHSRTGLVTTTYNSSGQITSIDDHGRVTSFGYDAMGRRIRTTLPDNSITHTSYWPSGQEKATWGSQTNPVVKLYDADGRLTQLRTFRSANLALAPDETTPNYDATTWTYNSRDQLTRKQYADGKGTDYTYTAAGRLHTRSWARGVVTTYGYNAAGELTTTDYSDTTPDVTVTYDRLGRQQTLTNGVAQSSFSYDPITLALATETIQYDLDRNGTPELTRTLDRSRDNLGRPTGYQLKDGTTIDTSATYTYSATDGRLGSVTGSGSNATFTYQYLPNSRLIETITGPAHLVTHSWDPTRDVLTSKQNKTGNLVVSQYDYSVNAIGQRSTVNQTGSAFASTRSIAWGYDVLGQVISADSSENAHDRAYQYDAIGNRLEARDGVTAVTGTPNYTANALNQYTVANSFTPTYDDDGNQQNAQIRPLGSSSLTACVYHWDAENRLIAIHSSTGSLLASYQYDAHSHRIAKNVPGQASTLTLYDAWNPIAEYQASSLNPENCQLKNSYLWGLDLSGSLQGAGGVGGLLSVTSHSSQGTSHYPTYDGNGNVSEYLNNSGSIAAHYEYDAFGNVVLASGSTPEAFAHRFSTKPQDAESGLNYYGYRYYDPITGRWQSRDPIEEDGGTNLYAFVGNDPNNWFDVLGESRVPYFEIGAAYSVQTPHGVFFSASISGKAEKDNSTPCCYYLTAKADFEIGIGLRLRFSGKASIGPFGFGFGVSGEFSLAKQTFSQEINVTYCPVSGSVTGSGKTYVIDLDLGGNAHLSGSLSGTVGKHGSITGELTGSATLAGKAQGWFDVSPATTGVKIDLLTRLYFDFAANLSGGYKVKYRGAILSSGNIPTIGGSIFGNDRPDTGEVTLGSWTLP